MKLRINLYYILDIPIKSLKTFKSVNATASSNSSSVGDVSDHDVNISIDHEDTSNVHDTNQSSSTLVVEVESHLQEIHILI